uniref:hypothetical protein n=1 Tax=Streptococcus pluranimalium TaxID=82348 RepID=UPI003F68D6D4
MDNDSDSDIDSEANEVLMEADSDANEALVDTEIECRCSDNESFSLCDSSEPVDVLSSSVNESAIESFSRTDDT